MKSYYSSLLFLILISSCATDKSPKEKTSDTSTIILPTPAEMQSHEFQTLLDSANLKGSILTFDVKENTFHSNNFAWARRGKLPASTFKIPNSIIALETGVVESDSTLFDWDGVTRSIKTWNQDLIFKDAFKYSCVPCYQDIARKIGAKRMTQYLDTLDYTNMVFDKSNIDMFWLEGESRISQFQQIDFIKRLYESKLPISNRTENIVKDMMLLDKNEKYTLSGKTGWSISKGENNGWFVGYLESKNKTYLFATNIDPTCEFDMKHFPRIRKEITIQALQLLM